MEVPASVTLLRNIYTEALASLSSTVKLAECLVEKGLISSDTVDKIIELEGENELGLAEGKELLIDLLMSLGVAKVAIVKKTLREFEKFNKSSSVVEQLDVKVPPSFALSATENGVEPPYVEREPQAVVRKSKRRHSTEMESFSLLFYSLIQQLLASYEKSSTMKSRVAWLHCNVPANGIARYFPHFDVHEATGDRVVSVAMLLEAFKQLRHKDERREKRRETEREMEKMSVEVESLTKALAEKDRKIEEVLSVNDQWRLECSDLKQLIKQNNENPEDSGLSSNEHSDIHERVKELEAQLRDSIRNEDYELLLTEKREREERLEELTDEKESQKIELEELHSELTQLKEANESYLNEMESLKNENEEHQNYIEELRDQVSNLKLNFKSREPSVREMALLLEKNRKMSDELTVVKAALEEETKSTQEKIRTLQMNANQQTERLEKDKQLLEKELSNAKDELLALRTYIKDLEEDKKRPPSPKGVQRQSSRTTPIYRPLPDHLSGGGGGGSGPISFSSQQRKCPCCSNVFRELSDKEFMSHVADCFK